MARRIHPRLPNGKSASNTGGRKPCAPHDAGTIIQLVILAVDPAIGRWDVNVTRRVFLRAGSGAIVASTLGFNLQRAYAQSRELKISRTTETRSTCPLSLIHI